MWRQFSRRISHYRIFQNLFGSNKNQGSRDVKGKIYFFQKVNPGYHLGTLAGESTTGSPFETAEVVLVEAGKLAEVTLHLE